MNARKARLRVVGGRDNRPETPDMPPPRPEIPPNPGGPGPDIPPPGPELPPVPPNPPEMPPLPGGQGPEIPVPSPDMLSSPTPTRMPPATGRSAFATAAAFWVGQVGAATVVALRLTRCRSLAQVWNVPVQFVADSLPRLRDLARGGRPGLG